MAEVDYFLPSYRTTASDFTCSFLDFSGSFNLKQAGCFFIVTLSLWKKKEVFQYCIPSPLKFKDRFYMKNSLHFILWTLTIYFIMSTLQHVPLYTFSFNFQHYTFSMQLMVISSALNLTCQNSYIMYYKGLLSVASKLDRWMQKLECSRN